MIAVVHGPRGCGKSTALRDWLARRGWMPPRGFRTYFDGSPPSLRLAPWKEGASICEITEKPAFSGDFPPSSTPCPPSAWDPAFAPALDAFLDAVFLGASPTATFHVQPPIPSSLPVPSTPRFPWSFDAPAYWRAALSTLDGDPARPIVIDELGLFETLSGALDPTALRRLLAALHAAPRAIVVVQERAFAFWLNALSLPAPCTIR